MNGCVVNIAMRKNPARSDLPKINTRCISIDYILYNRIETMQKKKLSIERL